MEKRNSYVCKHNPSKNHNWITCFLLFFFSREKALNSYCCAQCGTALHIPHMNAPLKIGFFWFSIWTTFGIYRLSQSGGIFSSPLISLCSIYLIIYFVYRAISSLVLTFGNWTVSEFDDNELVQEKMLKKQGHSFMSFALSGIIACVTCVQETYIAFMTFVASIVLIINCVTQKKWRIGIVVGVASIIFSILSLFGQSEHIVIDCAILIAMISLSIAVT